MSITKTVVFFVGIPKKNVCEMDNYSTNSSSELKVE
jgi:hypothetical protein